MLLTLQINNINTEPFKARQLFYWGDQVRPSDSIRRTAGLF